MGWSSSVGMETRYRLGGPGIESRWGRDFPHPFRTSLGPTQTPVQWAPGLSRSKASGAWRWPTTLSSAEVKEGVELYLYSTGLSWAFTWRTLPLPLMEKRQTYIPTYLCIGMCYLRINLCVLHEGEMGEWSYRSIYSKPWLWVQVTDQLPTSRPFASAEGTKLVAGWAPGSLWASWMSKGHFRSSSQ